jgi:hypothetical protein
MASGQGSHASVHDPVEQDPINLDPPENGYSSDEDASSIGFTQAAKRRWKSTTNFGKDTWAITQNSVGRYKGTLCTACREIPFHECLPTSPENDAETPASTAHRQGAVVFYRSLSKILNNRETCKLCGLLTQSICQKEYDLLAPEHIRNYLPDNFDQNRSMADWIGKNNYWKREWVGGAGLWPFGYALDRSEAANSTLKDAKRLFTDAENRDTYMNNFTDMYSSDTDDARRALDATQYGFGMLYAANIRNKRLEHLYARIQVVSGQLALLQNKKRKRLPCIFMFRMYRKDERKSGALSVRVYGHGRAPLAPLKEICHFSLRFETGQTPRCFESQLWYGNRLADRIDTSFFQHCIRECESKHSDRNGCSSLLSKSTPHSINFSGNAKFRLINVDTMSLMEIPFKQITVPGSPYRYAALSYRWGELPLLDGWRKVSDSEYHKTNRSGKTEIRNDRPNATKLIAANETFLHTPNSLKQKICIIPNTIRDAIEVAKGAGVKYLWVDQLCIMQSGNNTDKKGNIERMDCIYDHALFTIVAADGLDANAGLKGVGKARGSFEQIINEDIIPGTRMFLPVNMQMNHQPWEERAWCFQEKVLSRRLLVFAGGFAVWYCRGGIWREDVNALDGDISAVKFPWLRLTSPTLPEGTILERSGLELQRDDSVRLIRRPAMRDYIAAVEDLSKRSISYSWDILNAFGGLSKVMESSNHLNTPFWQGIPLQDIDVALLWQTCNPARRRKHNCTPDGRIIHYAPPSWSPFGWEANMKVKGSGVEGASIKYGKPFHVWSGDNGVILHYDMDLVGEERIRPIRDTFWKLDTKTSALHCLGLFTTPVMDGANPTDWESSSQEVRSAYVQLPSDILNAQHLVIAAETAMLKLGQKMWRTTRTVKVGGIEQSVVTFEETCPHPNTSVSDDKIEIHQEYWLDTKTMPRAGVMRIDMAGFDINLKDVKAVVLSEAQYFGNEDKPDVLGYPLYNIMLIRRIPDKKGLGQVFAERVGLGQIYKFAWRTSNPKKQVIVLE